MKTSKTNKVGVFYRSNGRWTPVRTLSTDKPRSFTSKRELNRFLNSYEFNVYKNYYLKSRVSVRNLTRATV